MTTAQDIMTREVITANENLSVRELARIFADNRISGAPVVDDQGNLVGVVTESDLIDQAKKVHIPTVMAFFDSFVFLENPDRLEKDLKKMAASTVGDVCSREVVSVEYDAPLEEIATIMAEKNRHTLPVMEKGRMVGVIGKSDIIRTLAQNE
ncbi:MAG: CBS domain-containing protein [Desulfobulbaceae bacterium]|jgi:predicted transcriptional regulator|nr:CBS domain-containing protein [Desulfobulbaceae bacterium]MDY0350526.1 CBS domain-containing protein [Desulfobulbaceae bacterium]